MAVASNFPAIRPSLNLDFANSKVLDPRITFNRASAATYYDGKTVAKAEENLFIYSQTFSSGPWVKVSATITDSFGVAPDGSTTAARLQATGSYSFGQAPSGVVSGKEYVLSFWVKSNTGVDQTFRSQYGTTGFQSNVASTSWTRVQWLVTWSGFAGIYLAVSDIAGNPLDILIWGAQLEQRSQVTAYTPTTTQPITNYIPVLQTAPAGVPRFDHNPVTGESLGLLVEEQKTNLFTFSEQFENSAWGKSNLVVESNSCVAPDGSLSADKLIESSTNTVHAITWSFLNNTAEQIVSFYAKAAGRSVITTSSNGSISAAVASFNLNAVTATGAQAISITPVGNGWFRCVFKKTVVTNNPHTLSISLHNEISSSYLGDGYSGIYIWGAQLEAGAFPTSYIKTDASQVTRAADSAQMTGSNFSSWYQQGEGSLIAEARNIVGATVFSTAVLTDDQALQTNNRLALFNRPSGVSGACALISYGNSEQISNGFIFKEINKIAIAYKNNDVTAALNGSTSTQDILANIPAFTKLRIGQLTAGSDFFATQTIKRLTYYPKRLTDAQLQALTA